MHNCNSGDYNTALGVEALTNNFSGNYNTAAGHGALRNTTGSYNIGMGENALYSNTSGSFNVAIGTGADAGAVNLSNAVAIGYAARVDASHSMVLGSIAGINGAPLTIKVGIGTTLPQTRLHVDRGTDADYTNTSGYIVTGDVAGANLVLDNNEILARNNGVASALYLQASGGNVKIGNGAAPAFLLELASNSAGKPGSNTWTISSDARLKKDIKPFSDGLDVIKQINPVWFRYNGTGGITDTATYVGILAQDIKKIAPYMVGTYSVDNKGVKENYLNYDGNAMTYILVNALKEQQKMIEEQLKQKETQQQQIDELRKEIEFLKKQLLPGNDKN